MEQSLLQERYNLREMLSWPTTLGQAPLGSDWESDCWSRLINSSYKKLSGWPLHQPLSSPWLTLKCLLNKHLQSHQGCAQVNSEHCECLQRNSIYQHTWLCSVSHCFLHSNSPLYKTTNNKTRLDALEYNLATLWNHFTVPLRLCSRFHQRYTERQHCKQISKRWE